MRRWLVVALFGTLALAVLLGTLLPAPVPSLLQRAAGGAAPAAMDVPAPDLAGIDPWINSKPLRWRDLRGRVVVVHFWTFG